jgi:hypothetical protein
MAAFEFNYKVTGNDRKRLVSAIGEILEVPPKYLGAPTFAYEVDYITIDKNGIVSFDDRADSDEIEMLVEALLEKGFEPEACFEDLQMTEEEELGLGRQRRDPIGEDGMQPSDVPDEDKSEDSGDSLILSYPRKDISDAVIENLRLLVASKESLIKKVLGANALPIEVTDEVVSFPWFAGFPQPEEISTYAHFTGKLIGMAKTQKRVTAKEKETDNEKYAFRCFLLRLGFIGDEYKAARKILLRNLSGSGAFKSGNPKVQEIAERINADADLYDDVMSLQDKEVESDEISE